MTREYTLNNVITCPVRDKMLVETIIRSPLRRAVGTQLVPYIVPNGTNGVCGRIFYQYRVPNGTYRIDINEM